MKKFILITAIGFLALAKAAALPSPFEPQIVKAFADSLYDQGFFTQAEGEYKRYLFSADSVTQDQNPEYNSALNSLCNIYNFQNNRSGIEWLREGFYSSAEISVKQKINLLNAKFLFTERKQREFDAFAKSIQSEQSLFTPEFVNTIQASSFVLNNQISELSELCNSIIPSYSVFEKLGELSSSYKLKSPGLALFLSMIIPGSGKWYTGSFGTFVSSFISIGSFAAGTVITGIKTSWKSWQPYVFGACGVVLYIADIYGAYQSAKRYNDTLYRNLCEETEKIYGQIY